MYIYIYIYIYIHINPQRRTCRGVRAVSPLRQRARTTRRTASRAPAHNRENDASTLEKCTLLFVCFEYTGALMTIHVKSKWKTCSCAPSTTGAAHAASGVWRA